MWITSGIEWWLRQRISARVVAFGLILAALPLTALADPSAKGRPAIDIAMDAVLIVSSNDAEDRFLGSAFLWGGVEGGVIAVTNAHVAGDAEELRLTDRKGREVTGEVIAIDRLRDVAVISVPMEMWGPTEMWGGEAPLSPGLIPASEAAVTGLDVYALGAPLGAEFSVTRGMISAMARQIDLAVPLMFVQHDAAVNPGSSGGPLIDSEGRLIGMNSRIVDGSRMFVGIAYAIAAPDLARIVEGLIAEELTPFPKLGLSARPVDRKLAAALGLAAAGWLVDGVDKGGLAQAAGIRAGDIVLAVDGTALTAPGGLAFALEAALHRGAVQVTVLRGAERQSLTLRLIAASDAASETGAIGLRLRGPDDSNASALPERINSYPLAALGVVWEEGRISDLTANSPAALAGLARGDTILAVNGAPVTAGLAQITITGPTLLLVAGPGGATRHLWLDPWGSASASRAIGGATVLDPAVTVF